MLLTVLLSATTADADAPLASPAEPPLLPNCAAGKIGLTFDDGPVPRATLRLVRTLTTIGVPATFFMLGERVDANPEVVRKVRRAGFPVGNHTYNHEDLTALSTSEIVETMQLTQDAFHDAGVRSSGLARAPFGRTNPRVDRALRTLGLSHLGWNIGQSGSESGNAQHLANHILNYLEARVGRPKGVIVLLHDGDHRKVDVSVATRKIVFGARRMGYCFGSVDSKGHVNL